VSLSFVVGVLVEIGNHDGQEDIEEEELSEGEQREEINYRKCSSFSSINIKVNSRPAIVRQNCKDCVESF